MPRGGRKLEESKAQARQGSEVEGRRGSDAEGRQVICGFGLSEEHMLRGRSEWARDLL